MQTPEHHVRSEDPGLMFTVAESGARRQDVRRSRDARARRADREPRWPTTNPEFSALSNVANEPRAVALQRRVGSICVLARLALRAVFSLVHVRSEHRIDSGLVAWPLRLEPIQHVLVDPQ